MACAVHLPGSCTCGGPQRFTRPDALSARDSLARRLVCVADELRDLYTSFGLRPYVVRIIRTRWTGGARGLGEEYVTHQREILPTPRISDLSSLTQVLHPIGLDEHGSIQLSEVSGRYTEDELRGLDSDGTPPAEDEQTYYEVEFPRVDSQPGERRRFFLRSAPMYQSDRFQWTLTLERAHEGRDRAGELR